MTIDFVALFILFLELWQLNQATIKRNHYTNTWAVNIEKGPEVARQIARKYDFTYIGPVGGLEHMYIFQHDKVRRRSRRSADKHNLVLDSHPDVLWLQQQTVRKRRRRGYVNDPLFPDQWYLKNVGQTEKRCHSRLDINVFPAWNKNITGRGVVVSILDDGLELNHPDLRDNYDGQASHDFNDNDPDPTPRYTQDNINKHGTRCAGEVAAAMNNRQCGVGVAFNAKVGGIRMLDGDVTDAVEAASLSFSPQHIDIYSSSWGPDDDGKTVDGPGPLAKKAFRDGIRKGRNGLGSIFVWATGNGGRFNDYCSCDGYINSPYTISIGAVDNCGHSPWYAEACPGTLAVTYSSGQAGEDLQIATTDLHGKCTKEHTGTSAAAPLAAGIFALVLEANRKLTWRDLQHLIVKTSKVISKEDNEWQKNGAGHMVNNKFGFGALDTGALIEAATSSKWKTSRQLHVCESRVADEKKAIPQRGFVTSAIKTDGCTDMNSCITKLEHVHVYVTIKHVRRGKLKITLTAPSGVKSPLLKNRARDTSAEGFESWVFLTVFSWDEDPKGTWQLAVFDESGRQTPGTLVSWHLKFYGTCDVEDMMNITINETEICDSECKRGCPISFSDVCKGCSHFCDCTMGMCVPDCDDHLITDNQLRHCRRSVDTLEYSYIPNSGALPQAPKSKPLIGISISAKFAIICLALIILSCLIAGIAYLASKMPSAKDLPRGYHSVKNYPNCQDVDYDDTDTAVAPYIHLKS